MAVLHLYATPLVSNYVVHHVSGRNQALLDARKPLSILGWLYTRKGQTGSPRHRSGSLKYYLSLPG